MKRASTSAQTSTSHKSKRSKPNSAAASEEETAAKLSSYIYHATKLLSKALKKSKSTEIQKLVRKLKLSATPELDSSLATLKAFQLEALTTSLLHKKLSSLSYFPAQLLPPPPPPAANTGPKSPIDNQLLKSAPVRSALDEIERAVAKRVGVEVPPPTIEKKTIVKVKEKQKKELIAPIPKDDEVEEGEGDDSIIPIEEEAALATTEGGEKRLSKRALRAQKSAITKAAIAANPKLKTLGIKMNEDRRKALVKLELEALEEREKEMRGDVSDSGSGSGSGSDGEEESGDADDDDDDEQEDEEEKQVRRELKRLGGGGDDSDEDSDLESSGSFSSGEEEEEEQPKQPLKPVKVTKTKLTNNSKPTTTSTFLPTLASGYISYSDSDSDGGGDSAQWVKQYEKEELKEGKERKNRRGQRARRAIWEQKYGSGALHIVKESGGVPAPTKGSSSKSKSRKDKVEPPVPAPPAFDPTKDISNANSQPVGIRRVVKATSSTSFASAGATAASGGEKLHPSWEAKKKAKLAMEATLASGGCGGKKIVFD